MKKSFWTVAIVGLLSVMNTSCNVNVPLDVEKPAEIVYGSFKDARDGIVYKTIQIGDQTWMAENLRYMPEVYRNGDVYRGKKRYYVYGYNGTDVAKAREYKAYSSYIGHYNDVSTWLVFGTLYNHTAAQSAAPEGWRLPTSSDFHQLAEYLENHYPSIFKNSNYNDSHGMYGAALFDPISATMGWYNRKYWDFSPYLGQSGFNAMPAGYVYGLYVSEQACLLGRDTYYWIENSSYRTVEFFSMSDFISGSAYDSGFNTHSYDDRDWYGYSVRCIKKN